MPSLRKPHVPACLPALLLLACASVPPPEGRLLEAERALEAALAADADEHAPIELRFARERLESARQAMAAGEHAQAGRLIEESIVNAELAEAKTAAALAREAARRQGVANESLQAELGEILEGS